MAERSKRTELGSEQDKDSQRERERGEGRKGTALKRHFAVEITRGPISGTTAACARGRSFVVTRSTRSESGGKNAPIAAAAATASL